jgi:hypothetical protein
MGVSTSCSLIAVPVLPTSMDALTRLREDHAIIAAYHTGRHAVQRRVALTEATLRKEFAEERRTQEKATAKAADQTRPAAETIDIPEDHVLVCHMSDADMKNPKMREIIMPSKPAINIALPLVPVPVPRINAALGLLQEPELLVAVDEKGGPGFKVDAAVYAAG